MREKTYIVNMLKDVSKKAAMEAQLASHAELDWQFWEAVEGRSEERRVGKECYSFV